MSETADKELEKMFFGKELDGLSKKEKEELDKSLQKSYEELEKEFRELEHLRIQAAKEALEDGQIVIDTKSNARDAIDRHSSIIYAVKNNTISNASEVLKKRDGFVSKYVEKLAKKDGYL